VLHLGKVAYVQLETSIKAFLENNEESVYRVFDIEKRVNDLSKATLEYLVKLDKASLTDYEKDKLIVLMNVINDIERVGDHADNIAELVLYKIENNANFSEEAINELNVMFEDTKDAYQASLNALKTIKVEDCKKIMVIDSRIDKMYKDLRKNHIERLNTFVCEPNAGVIFLDIIGNLERIGDHSSNISQSILDVLNKRTIIS